MLKTGLSIMKLKPMNRNVLLCCFVTCAMGFNSQNIDLDGLVYHWLILYLGLYSNPTLPCLDEDSLVH